MSVNGIEIKVGQKWSTRTGRVVTVVGRDDPDPDDKYPWLLDTREYVTDTGRYSLVHENHPLDLIELVSQPDEPQVTMLEADSPDAESLAVETLSALGWVFDGICWVQDHPSAYDKLADVLHRALLQASQGKGKERHAVDGVAFEDQPMATINKQLGSVHGYVYQCHKKSLEAMRLPAGRDVAELLGAINYLCGAVIALETWARKGD